MRQFTINTEIIHWSLHVTVFNYLITYDINTICKFESLVTNSYFLAGLLGLAA